MKKFIKTFLFSIFIFLISDKVYANNIDSINMDIYLDKYGNANITEEWNANLTDGTEGFRYFGNLGNSTITNYSVRSESRDFSQYSSDNSWNVNASFSEKAYKYGINNNNGNKELCFGISSYGHHKYTLSYTVTGFVGQTEDSQVLYWELIPTDLAKLTNNIYIKIHADQKFSDTLDVWGYGNYGGYAYVYDGYIEVSNQNLRSDEYVTVLVKFPNSTFETNNNIGNNFDYYYNMAEAGAEHYVDNSSSVDNSFAFIPFLVFGFNFIIWVLIIVFIHQVKV